jgi:hypothetical protein
MNLKRMLISIILGAIFGIICVIGNIIGNGTPFLIAAWYNRVILGAMIGFAGDFKIYKGENNIINSILRGLIIGAFVSLGFAFFLHPILVSFFIAGLIFGILIDVISTLLSKK